MQDDGTIRGCAEEWEPGDGPPAWLAWGLAVLVLALLAAAVLCYRAIAAAAP